MTTTGETSGPAAATRHPALDWLKALAITAVVVTHAGAIAFPGHLGWSASDTLFRHLLAAFHVPCLLMASGFLYYRSRPIEWVEIGPRVQRILLPYLVSSCVAFALLWEMQTPLGSMLFALLTGNALPIYYYVLLLTVLVVLLPLISRLPVVVLASVVVLLLVLLVVLSAAPELLATRDYYWAARNPIESFALGYFLIGWLTAALSSLAPRAWPRSRYLAVLGLGVAWPVCVAIGSPYPSILLARFTYALVVWSTIWRFLDARPAPAFVRWISDASYGIFLYHYFAIRPLLGVTFDWFPPIRIATLTVAGVASGLLLGVCIQTLLGKHRAKQWFGY